MTRYAAAVLADADGRMLLGLRHASRANYPGVWDFIGGHCNDGEEAEAAMIRETEEEIGVRPNSYSRVAHWEEEGMQMTIFLVRSWSGEVTNCAADEHDALEWFSVEEARDLRLPHPVYGVLLDMVEKALRG